MSTKEVLSWSICVRHRFCWKSCWNIPAKWERENISIFSSENPIMWNIQNRVEEDLHNLRDGMQVKIAYSVNYLQTSAGSYWILPCSASLAAPCSFLVGKTLKQAWPSQPEAVKVLWNSVQQCYWKSFVQKLIFMPALQLNLTDTIRKMSKTASALPHYLLPQRHPLLLRHTSLI